jgi:uncharacterized damage-inducible protein DinB
LTPSREGGFVPDLPRVSFRPSFGDTMATRVIRTVLRIPRGYRSSEVASFMAQLEELSARLARDARGLTVRELEWQPGPGMNSIGMLLAHLAIVEVWWFGGPGQGKASVDFERILGIGIDDDGMPCPPRGKHPKTLAGRPLSYYTKLLSKARRYVKGVARTMTLRDLERPRRRTWKSQKAKHHYNDRWVIYHVLEHYGGHYGQILLLKHWLRDRGARR